MQNEVINIESLDQLYELAGSHQVTLQEFLNRKTKVRGEWLEITYSHELRDAVIKDASDTIGGRKDTKDKVIAVLTRQHPPQHWALRRFYLQKYSASAFFGYGGAKDMPYEMAETRKLLKKLY